MLHTGHAAHTVEIVHSAEAPEAFYQRVFPDRSTLAPSMWRLMSVGHLVEIDLARIGTRFDLGAVDLYLLGVLRSNVGQPLCAAELAEVLNVSQPAVSMRLSRLSGRKLIVRKRDPEDHRAFTIELTEEGKRISDLSVVAAVENSNIIRALRKLPTKDIAELTRIMVDVHAEMNRSILAGHPDRKTECSENA